MGEWGRDMSGKKETLTNARVAPPLRAAILAAGGKSRRMGQAKALLPLGGRPLLQWVIAAARQADCDPIFVVGQPMEGWQPPEGVVLLEDRHPGKGPLAALEAGLAASEAPWNLLLACDLPFLSARFLQALFAEAETHWPACQPGVVVPADAQQRLQPLSALYHRHLLPLVEEQLSQGALSMMAFLDRVRSAEEAWYTVFRGSEALTPDLFFNVNTPDRYAEAKQKLLRAALAEGTLPMQDGR